MGSRYVVEVAVGSAKELKNVNWKHGDLKPYAVLWVDSAAKSSTQVDFRNDTEPVWDEKLTIAVPPHITIGEAILSIDIVHYDPPEGTKPLIGSAILPIKEIVNENGFGDRAFRKLKLKRPSGRPQGKLELHVTVRELPRYADHSAPPYGYPASAPPPPAGYPYAAPPAGYPYGAPLAQPPVGYAYGAPPPHQPVGYGAPPPVYGNPAPAAQPKKSKSGLGAGLAVGAVAGVLGGLALAEGVDYLEDKIADDAARKVEEDIGYYDDD